MTQKKQLTGRDCISILSYNLKKCVEMNHNIYSLVEFLNLFLKVLYYNVNETYPRNNPTLSSPSFFLFNAFFKIFLLLLQLAQLPPFNLQQPLNSVCYNKFYILLTNIIKQIFQQFTQHINIIFSYAYGTYLGGK